jgi:PAS domain S-box-containing protein
MSARESDADVRALLDVAVSNLHAQNSRRAQAEAALRESEQRYRSLVELSPEAILVIRDERLAYVNGAGLKLFGATSLHELLSITLLDLVKTPHRARVEAGLHHLAANGGVTRQAELYLQRLDGSPIEADVTAIGITFDGAPAVQVLVHDVSERKAIERLKDELLSMASHELRTPLTSVRGSLGLLASGLLGELPARGQRMLDIALSNTDRLIRLLNDMLDLERLRAGRVTLHVRPCTLADVVDQTMAVVRESAERADVQLVVGTVEGCVEADPDRLVQVLTNLLSNSVKFSAPGGQVRLDALHTGAHVRLRVADDGRGIPADQLERIFERFQQVDASDSRLKGGSGLGLAICRSLVQQHGGRVWAESTLGMGSTFYVELRAAASPRPVPAAA